MFLLHKVYLVEQQKKMAVSVSPPLHPPPPPPLGLSTESDKTPAIVPASALQMQASDSKAAHLINGGCGHRWSHNYAVMVDLWTCSNLSCVYVFLLPRAACRMAHSYGLGFMVVSIYADGVDISLLSQCCA